MMLSSLHEWYNAATTQLVLSSFILNHGKTTEHTTTNYLISSLYFFKGESPSD
jgi:hypothetical protein